MRRKGMGKRMTAILMAVAMSISMAGFQTVVVRADDEVDTSVSAGTTESTSTTETTGTTESAEPTETADTTEEPIVARFYLLYKDKDQNKPDANVDDPTYKYVGNKSGDEVSGALKRAVVTHEIENEDKTVALADGSEEGSIENLLDQAPGEEEINKLLVLAGYTQEEIKEQRLTINWFRTMYYPNERYNGKSYYHVDGCIATKPMDPEETDQNPSGTTSEEGNKEVPPTSGSETTITPDPGNTGNIETPVVIPENPTPTTSQPGEDGTGDHAQTPSADETDDVEGVTEIIDEPVPLSDETEIEDEEVPLAEDVDMDDPDDADTDETTIIDDDDVPLSDNPKTGDSASAAWFAMSLMAALGLFAAFVTGQRKREA